jgi:N-acetylneuraminic acid mutarotase
VAQKGPLILGSTVTAQELDSALSPTGKQYSYQITSDLGTFSPTSTFGSQYIGVNATGYYFDEIANAVSSGTITLNGYSDLSATAVLNVNLLTTLAYQRIQHLVTASSMTFSAAQTQAENEVLAALGIPNGSQYGPFGALDISKSGNGNSILATVSSLFVYGNSAGPLSALIASFQSDIAANGAITSAATKSALATAAANVNLGTVAANLTQKYASAGVSFKASDLAPWVDQDGAGVVGAFKFQVTSAAPTSTFSVPSAIVTAAAGQMVSVTAGQLSVNGSPVSGPVMISASDSLTISPGTSAFGTNGVLTTFLVSGTTKLARVQFIAPGADVWLPAMQMNVPRTYHSAVTLANGQVLVSGGVGPNNAVYVSAELYNPTANSWSYTGSLTTARYLHTSTVLASGKVLVAAGYGSSGAPPPLTSAELYDPVAGMWSSAGSLSTARIEHTATLLPNGQVLVVGGQDGNNNSFASAELYIPSSNSWSATGSLASARTNHTATLLQNGLVLVAGGTNAGGTLSSAELYNPATGTWSAAGTMSGQRANHTATLLQNGMVLAAGGFLNNGSLATADLYNPSTNTWSLVGSMSTGRLGHTATLLPNGSVLVAGGGNLASAEIFNPSSNLWTAAASMANARSYFTAALLDSGTVLVAGGQAPTVPGTLMTSAEIYW